jgi:hypothetical protein
VSRYHIVEQHWAGHDIALVRTAGEIFANAIARERHKIRGPARSSYCADDRPQASGTRSRVETAGIRKIIRKPLLSAQLARAVAKHVVAREQSVS